MAFLKDITFTGKLGGLTAYKMKGTDKIVLRRSGGPSKDTVNNSPAYALNRLHRREFGASATLCKYIRFMLGPLRTVSNYNITARINALLTRVKEMDTEGELGKRALRLSSLPTLLQGLPLNKRTTFDTILFTAVTWSLSRETRSARVEISELVRNQNFFPPHEHPYFCITAVLGIVPDILYNEDKGTYGPPDWFDGMYAPVQVSSDWYPAQHGAPPVTLELNTDQLPADESYSVMLSIGVRFGLLLEDNKIELLKHMGGAKILGVK
jgi:hypothetical protein